MIRITGTMLRRPRATVTLSAGLTSTAVIRGSVTFTALGARTMIRARASACRMRTAHRRVGRPAMIYRRQITPIVTRHFVMRILCRGRPDVMLRHRGPFPRRRPRA